jgi:hypothetical protein
VLITTIAVEMPFPLLSKLLVLKEYLNFTSSERPSVTPIKL